MQTLTSGKFLGLRLTLRWKLLMGGLAAFTAWCAMSGHGQSLAPTPPMGWNSYDAYGLSITEQEFKANVTVLAGLKQYGWEYAVIDAGWYMQNPAGANLQQRKYVSDKNGLLMPVVERFPSAADGEGLKPLADWVHAHGLKFGIHIMRGIPKDVVLANVPIADSSFHAAEAADVDEGCGWDDGNYGIRDNAAGQAYYDSMFKLFARWDIDLIKADCISARPFRPTEIRQIAEAIKNSGRPMVLSLSPGPSALENAAYLAQYSQTWRASDDHWDLWSRAQNTPGSEFPFGLSEAFDRTEEWIRYARPGAWPDYDMMPLGWLTPRPGMGEPRESRLTPDEQRTEFTLWAFARSPLILGANLTKLDDSMRSLMSNSMLIAVDQRGLDNHPVRNLPAGFEHVRVWSATVKASAQSTEYFAFFNLDDKPVTLHFSWGQFGRLGKNDAFTLSDGEAMAPTAPVDITLPVHGSAVYGLQTE
jgi:hypothetical protein